MGDAEIIPIGTRGRPGRGTSRHKPSAAARSLVKSSEGSPSSSKRAKRPTGPGPQGRPAGDPAGQPVAPKPRKPVQAPPQMKAVDSSEPKPPATTEDRLPSGLAALTGLPVAELMSALGHAAREVFGDDWERQLARFLAFLRRRVNGDYTVDDFGFDQELTERFMIATLRPLADKWFRVEVRGAENIPTEGGALVVSNHSGTIPLDSLVTAYCAHRETGRFLRPLGADLVFKLPIVSSIARKSGATLACNEDAERMLRGGELVGVWPEGFKGIGKPFSERYKLQRFGRGGFVGAALRTGVPIIPLSVVGAEEIYPLIGNVPSLARLLGMPYLPITPLFPWLGPLGLVPLPSKWIIEFGEPVRTDSYDEGAAEDPMLVFDVTDQVRESIQQNLYTLLMDRGSIFG